jgi:hypothetical protein
MPDEDWPTPTAPPEGAELDWNEVRVKPALEVRYSAPPEPNSAAWGGSGADDQ